MSWMKKNYPVDDSVEGAVQRVQTEFFHLFEAVGSPVDAALFARDLSGGGQALFFSPKAADLSSSWIAANRAVACDAPTRQGTKLLVGQDGAWKLLG